MIKLCLIINILIPSIIAIPVVAKIYLRGGAYISIDIDEVLKQCTGTLEAWSYGHPYYVTAGHCDAYDSTIDEIIDAFYKDPTDTGWK